jgi:hypothetical protein
LPPGADVPPAARLVELGASNPGIEADVALQVMAGYCWHALDERARPAYRASIDRS